jgi:hypothetical protein
MTIDMFYEWTDILRVRCATDRWNVLSCCLRDYTEALRQMGCEYFEQMLDHCYKGECLEIWIVDTLVKWFSYFGYYVIETKYAVLCCTGTVT